MNKVILIGRITKDPELRNTPTGVSVVSFTVAVNRTYQDKNGERQADFINCIAWRSQAENLARFIKKGALIAVDGSIQTRSYDDQNGVRRYATEVIVSQVTFLESKKDNTFNDFPNFNQVPQGNNSNSYSNSYNNNYQNYNYANQNSNNSSYSNSSNYGYGKDQANSDKNSNTIEDINKAFDITSDDLPF